MQRGEWTLSRETALCAAQLQPYDANILLRLSACYGQERDFINAHLYFERGCALLSAPERASYVAKLERLREQASDVKNNVYKEDPLDKLPPEIVINIIQLGLEEDPLFALKCSWVNQRWRNTINHNCPELWRKWTLSDEELGSPHMEARRRHWLIHAGGEFDVVSLQALSSLSINRLPTDIAFEADKRLEVKVQNMDLLDSFVRKNQGDAGFSICIESLRLDVGRVRQVDGGSRYRERQSPSDVLTCNLPVYRGTLRSLELLNIGFSSYYLNTYSPVEIQQPDILSYPALKHLYLENCLLPDVFAETGVDSGTGPGLQYQADALHNTLRGARLLENLEVVVSWYNRRAPDSGLNVVILLEELHTAILPPTSVWSIDIVGRNLKSLAFRLLKTNGKYSPAAIDQDDHTELIPDPDDTVITVSSMALLETVELLSSPADDISKLRAWICRLPNVSKLVIRDIEQFPYPEPYGKAWYPANRVSNRALQLLSDNPDWCPALTTLHFESCFTPGRSLVEWIRQRKQSTTCTTIKKLILEGCTS